MVLEEGFKNYKEDKVRDYTQRLQINLDIHKKTLYLDIYLKICSKILPQKTL